jgi:hypothetical protein
MPIAAAMGCSSADRSMRVTKCVEEPFCVECGAVDARHQWTVATRGGRKQCGVRGAALIWSSGATGEPVNGSTVARSILPAALSGFTPE